MADEYQPMTAAELAAIRQRTEREARVFAMVYWPEFPSPQAYRDITALLADAAYWRGQVEQAAERMCAVEAENAELREIVRAVAKGPTACGIIPIAHICNFCDVPIGGLFARTDHRANCPVTKARAVLAVVSQAAQTEAEA